MIRRWEALIEEILRPKQTEEDGQGKRRQEKGRYYVGGSEMRFVDFEGLLLAQGGESKRKNTRRRRDDKIGAALKKYATLHGEPDSNPILISRRSCGSK